MLTSIHLSYVPENILFSSIYDLFKSIIFSVGMERCHVNVFERVGLATLQCCRINYFVAKLISVHFEETKLKL